MIRVQCETCKHERLNPHNPGIGMSSCRVTPQWWYPGQLHFCDRWQERPKVEALK